MLVNQQSIEALLLTTVQDTTNTENRLLYLKKPKIQLEEVGKHNKIEPINNRFWHVKCTIII